MRPLHIQIKLVSPKPTVDNIAEDACRRVYGAYGGKSIETPELVRQTAAWMVDRHDVQYGEAFAACRKWMFTEELIAENYSDKEISRLRAQRWTEKQIELHDHYLAQVSKHRLG